MESGSSIPCSHGLSNYPYPELQTAQFLVLIPISLRSILILSSHLRLALPKGIFPVGVPVKILKTLLPSSILPTWSAYPNLLDLIRYHDYIMWTIQTIVLNQIYKQIQTYYLFLWKLKFKFKRKIQTWTGIWRSEVESRSRFEIFLLNLISNYSYWRKM